MLTGARPSVLIVEDDYIAALDLEESLPATGFAVAGVAASADEALALATASHPTFVLMDIRLAGARDGVAAALDILRATGIRCLFATAHSDPQTRARAAAAQPLGWLSKPYTAHDLKHALDTAFAQLRAR